VTTQWEFGLFGLLLAAGVFVGMLVLLEVGRRIGQWRAAMDPDAPRVEVGAMDGAVFALLGLLIAFTFASAASRFDTRRQLAVEEANAIGTAYLRLDVLPPDAQPALREQFRQYVDARIAAYRSFPDLSAVKAELARAVRLQGEIWAQAVAASRGEGTQSARILVLPALNAMIDITTTRIVAARTHAPSIVYAMLVVLMLASSLLAGHRMAEGKRRSWIHVVGFSLTMAFALYVIVDLEFPRVGFIRLDAYDQLLVDVRASMK
jgi:hypothetical protein